ncbi:MAG: transcriptional repressor LexA [Clostridia bacterium]|nr:transcriptional repressor LexA [Clostridia bacterium]MBQ2327123.1 transcriptional repressor LexA [Clostridia bacterium]MBQ5813438.1 transcriptional repressor LexA [Clostridia bacterium]
MASKLLSPKRKAILDYIEQFTLENGYAPSVREIGDAVGLRSPSTVHSHLRILEDNGLLQKSKGKTRTLSISGQTNYKNVPLVGTVRAGAPILAQEEMVGYVPFEGQGGGELFALTVRGDSMKDAAILEDDVVIVRQQPTADNGQIVVALIDDEATVKRLKIEKGHIWLMPENPDYQPIDGQNCSILGVVVAVYRYNVR